MANPVNAQGQYSSATPTLKNQDTVPLQLDSAGNLFINEAVGPTRRGTLTDRSGTVATGGVSQTLAVANANRNYLLIENPTNATEPLYINFTNAAAVGGSSSISLAPGGSFTMIAPAFVSTELVTVTATTTGHAFTSKEQ